MQGSPGQAEDFRFLAGVCMQVEFFEDGVQYGSRELEHGER